MSAPERNHYDLLGIARDADATEVRRAWKMLVQVWHPDRFNGDMRDEAEAQAARINAAYHTLRDCGRRAAYDCRLAADEQAARPEPARPAASRPRTASAPRSRTAASSARVTVVERTFLESVGHEIQSAFQTYPRVIAGAVAALVLIVVASTVVQAVTGPSLPSSAVSAAAARTPAADTSSMAGGDDAPDLDDLAARAREDARAQNAAMERLMRENAAEDARVDAEDAAAAAAASSMAPKSTAPRAGATDAPAVPGTAATPSGGRIVRVMPTTS